MGLVVKHIHAFVVKKVKKVLAFFMNMSYNNIR